MTNERSDHDDDALLERALRTDELIDEYNGDLRRLPGLSPMLAIVGYIVGRLVTAGRDEDAESLASRIEEYERGGDELIAAEADALERRAIERRAQAPSRLH